MICFARNVRNAKEDMGEIWQVGENPVDVVGALVDG